jgi:hypothetical protein
MKSKEYLGLTIASVHNLAFLSLVGNQSKRTYYCRRFCILESRDGDAASAKIVK